jgi:hypothetical protein
MTQWQRGHLIPSYNGFAPLGSKEKKINGNPLGQKAKEKF